MPKISAWVVKFDGDKIPFGRGLRLAGDAAGAPLFRALVLHFHARVNGEVSREAEHRSMAINHKRVRFYGHRLAGDRQVNFHRHAEHHALAAPPLFAA